MSDYTPIIRGVLFAIYLTATMKNTDITNPKWWVAMLALNAALVI